MKRILALLLLLSASADVRAVTLDLVTIGDPNNDADVVAGLGLFGRVTNTYRISRTEITNAQYVEFLNAKAAADPLELFNTSMSFSSDGGIVRSGVPGAYNYAVKATATGVGPGGTNYGYADKPVAYVTWYDAIRFANWMSNGQGSGSTETGAYTLLGNMSVPSNADSITRNAGASWYLPNENEWYKAAYYAAASSSYFDYPTSSNAPPNNALPTSDTGNSANFLSTSTTTGDPGYPFTPVGAYQLSDSPYGTFDQGGNVAEWTETFATTGKRIRRGGAWNTTSGSLSVGVREVMTAGLENNSTGIRLAAALPPPPVPGDYNANGVVDAVDYVVWRNNLGSSFSLPNEVAGTTPGTVTQEDYNAWQARFGNTSGSGASAPSAAVPEPSAGILAALGVAFATIRGRVFRKRHRCGRPL
jgi:formylglycine-generating enzyme required for sulfatase activity